MLVRNSLSHLLTLIALLILPINGQAEFLTKDPAVGDVQKPPSLNKYLYAYQNPTVFIDPDGRTAEQFQALLTASIEKFRLSANRPALGTAGELKLEKILESSGEVIIKGPKTSPGQHNADIISYNPETKEITFFDNKIQTKKAAVSRANNLSASEGRARSIAEAQQKLADLNIDSKLRREISKALIDVADNPSKAVWAIANASPEELVEVSNKVKRISKRLADKGVRLADVTEKGIKVLTPDESVSHGKKIAKKLAKAIPVLGTAATTVDAATRISDAEQEDVAFRQAMHELGINSTAFDHHSVAREAAILTSEEAAGTGGAAAGATVVAPFSGACGFAALVCIGAGALVGGFAGDSAGSAGGAAAFDKVAEKMVGDEVERIKEQIRSNRKNSDIKTMVEDTSGTGTF